MQKELFDILAEKYLNGQADVTEKRVLFEYMDRMSRRDNSEEISMVETEKITAALYERLSAEITRDHSKVVPIGRKWFLRVSVAAIFLLAAGGGYWLMNHSLPKEQVAVNQIAQKDIPPGTNKAILTLAGGKRVLLDEAAAGKISESAIKTSDGKLVYQPGAAAVSYNTLITPRGGQHYVKLADGTEVWLNAASSITFPTAFTGKTRVVTITGEAYFEVAHLTSAGGGKGRGSIPFVVKVNGTEITVLGTHFNVMAYNDEAAVKTTLLEGSVKVNRGSEQVLLQPGQQALINKSGLKKVTSPDIEEVMAWRNGIFLLNGTDVSAVMRQISRWYDVEIEYRGAIPGGHLTGDIPRTMPLSKIIEGLKMSGIPCEMEGKKIIVSP
jgi:ferric-dicitrate binding protein FerR (iron transport regulator)